MPAAYRVILGDARRMPELEDNSIQLVVTSPPYPMIEMWDEALSAQDSEIGRLFAELNKTKDNNRVESRIYERMHQQLAEVWHECFRVLCQGGIACINIGDAARSLNHNYRLYANHARIIELCEETGFTTLPYILWKKPTNKPNAFLGSGFLPTNAYITLDMEYILILRKGKPRSFPPHDARRYASKYTKKQRDSWFSQVWTLHGAPQTRTGLERRAGAFPPELPERLIQMFSIKGDTVLDPFLGTGTTMHAAQRLGRGCVGYEIDPELQRYLKANLPQAEFLRRDA